MKTSIGYVFKEGDLMWTAKTTTILLIISFIGGALTAIVGIGGGVVYTPLLLEFGVHPKVTTSTSLFLVLYTSFSNSLQFAIGNQIIWGYGIWLAVWCAAGTVTGLTIINKLVERTG